MTWTDAEVSSNITTIRMNGVTLATSDENPATATVDFEGKKVAFKNGTANQSVDFVTNAAAAVESIDGSTFNYAFTYNGKNMADVTVKGMFTSAATEFVWSGVTLNKATLTGAITKLNIDPKVNLKADGTVNNYTAKTTTLNDAITKDGLAYANDFSNAVDFKTVTVANDAVLNVKNDVVINASTALNVSAKTGKTGSVAGVVNIHGTFTYVPGTIAGSVNKKN